MADIKKGMRVAFQREKGHTELGTVIRGGQKPYVVPDSEAGTGRYIYGPARLFTPTDIPEPKGVEIPVPVTLKKGDRVEWEGDNGETLYGVVAKGGSNQVKVNYDGGRMYCTGHASVFKISDKPLAVDTTEHSMTKWGIVGYKMSELGSVDSDCMEATITLNGKKVLHARDDGWGGGIHFSTLNGVSAEVEQAFYADTKAWQLQFSTDKDTNCVSDLWVEWYVKQRSVGVTSEMYWKDADAQRAKWNKPPQLRPDLQAKRDAEDEEYPVVDLTMTPPPHAGSVTAHVTD